MFEFEEFHSQMATFFLLFLCLLGLGEGVLPWTLCMVELKVLKVEDGVLALTIHLSGSMDLPSSQGKPLISRASPSLLQSEDSHLTFPHWFW